MDSIGIKKFTHRKAIHSESGVAANLLSHHGIPLSEPMAFGLGRGLSFGYYPQSMRLKKYFWKDRPVVTYRVTSGSIIKNVAKSVGASITVKKYKNPEASLKTLDLMLAAEKPVGLLTDLYWLPYIPKENRFPYPEHNVVVYGRRGNEYMISDPAMDGPSSCSREDLIRAIYGNDVGKRSSCLFCLNFYDHDNSVLTEARKAIRVTARWLLMNPFPFHGIRGIRLLSKRLAEWGDKRSPEQTASSLHQIITMQERIGTGGGGFRFLYSSFMQECAIMLGDEGLYKASQELIGAGKRWQDFAKDAVRIYRNNPHREGSHCYKVMAAIIKECGNREERMFKNVLRTC
ncbi:MAG: BtrH N-terminal domain-containing protein [Desulfobulbaceae bacterium]|nr:BtrH N-terminal domain-containing protein [Desulfobulbaceae bacterium]